MCFYENFRIDEEGKTILKLSRFAHIAIKYPKLRPLIKQLIKLPDNFIFRFIWKVTEALNMRVHSGATVSFFVKYFLFHWWKKVR
jgi:hypothetical protein